MLRIDFFPFLCYNPYKGSESVLKLYFKKLFFTILFIVNFFLLAYAIILAWYWLLPYKPLEIFRTISVTVLALVSDFAIVCAMRSRRLSHKNFMQAFSADTDTFGKRFINILKSKDNITHLIAFLSILTPFFVTVAVMEKTPFVPLVVGTLILLLCCGVLFLTVNTLLWCILYEFVWRG